MSTNIRVPSSSSIAHRLERIGDGLADAPIDASGVRQATTAPAEKAHELRRGSDTDLAHLVELESPARTGPAVVTDAETPGTHRSSSAPTDSGGINDQRAPSASPRATGRAKALQTIDPDAVINAIAWDPDGRRLVATNDDTISVGNIDSRQPKQSPIIQDYGAPFGPRWIVDVAFSPQGDRLATAIKYPR